MSKKDQIIEHFKTAISSTVKSISGNSKLEVSFGTNDNLEDISILRGIQGFADLITIL